MADKRDPMTPTERGAKSFMLRALRRRAEAKGKTIVEDVKIVLAPDGSISQFIRWDGESLGWVEVKFPETKEDSEH